jgi:hypothetical protein
MARWNHLTVESERLGWPKGRVYDLREWLPNVYLEKSDRASMLSGLEVRVPFLDPQVFSAALQYHPRGTDKRPLRSLLTELVPGVRLPARKMGLGVATRELTRTPTMLEGLELALDPERGFLTGLGADAAAMRVGATYSPTLSFRIAVLGRWSAIWS